jgi:hypothetical protein
MMRADNDRNTDFAPTLILRKFLDLIHSFAAQFPATVAVSGIADRTEHEFEKATLNRQTAIDRYGVTNLKVLANWTAIRFKLFLLLTSWTMSLLASFSEISHGFRVFLYFLDPVLRLCFAGTQAHAISS